MKNRKILIACIFIGALILFLGCNVINKPSPVIRGEFYIGPDKKTCTYVSNYNCGADFNCGEDGVYECVNNYKLIKVLE